MKYDVMIIGAGPGGIFSAYELITQDSSLKIAVFEYGNPLEKRHCPIDGDKIKSCINCKSCGIMNGFGGAGAFSDGKYNITNEFGGTLHEYIGKKKAIELMHYDKTFTFSGQSTYANAFIGMFNMVISVKKSIRVNFFRFFLFLRSFLYYASIV